MDDIFTAGHDRWMRDQEQSFLESASEIDEEKEEDEDDILERVAEDDDISDLDMI